MLDLNALDAIDAAELPAKNPLSGKSSIQSGRHSTSRKTPDAGPSDDQTVEFAVCPFQIQIDSREQSPWSFRGLGTDGTRDKPSRPLIVRTQVVTLPTADYSIEGFEDRIVIERKSKSDLYGTIGGGRERFMRELERMASIVSHPAGGLAAVIVEAGWQSILYDPPADSSGATRRMTPKSVYRSILAWQQREPFRRIHWLMLDTRELAERFAFRCLERFWLDEQERVKQPALNQEANRCQKR